MAKPFDVSKFRKTIMKSIESLSVGIYVRNSTDQ
jgi:hypothetical protein